MKEEEFLKSKKEIIRLLEMKSKTINAVKVGKQLNRIKDQKTYLMTRSKNFDEWLDSSDIQIKKRTAYSYIRLYILWESTLKRVVTAKLLNEIAYTKILSVEQELKEKSRPKQVEKLLSDIKNLNRTGVSRKMQKHPPLYGTAIFDLFFKKTMTLTNVKHRYQRVAGWDTINRLYKGCEVKFCIEIIYKPKRRHHKFKHQ